jgi:hypothetical protein
MMPPTVMVDVVNVATATRKTVVVEASEKRFLPLTNVGDEDAAHVSPGKLKLLESGSAGSAEEVLMPPAKKDGTVVPALANEMLPEQSQSPAVNETEVTVAATLLVSETPVAELLTNSPTLPALALLFVVVPTMPEVWTGVIAPEFIVSPSDIVTRPVELFMFIGLSTADPDTYR